MLKNCIVCENAFEAKQKRSKLCSRKCRNKNDKKAIAIYNKQHYQDNIEKCRETAKQWHRDNREESRARSKQWAKNNPEKVKANNKAWRDDNKEYAATTQKAWKKANPEQVAANHKKYYRKLNLANAKISNRTLTAWAIQIKDRDDWYCQHCFSDTSKLEAHHILGKTKYPQYALDLDNGLTLCISCHDIEHKNFPKLWK